MIAKRHLFNLGLLALASAAPLAAQESDSSNTDRLERVSFRLGAYGGFGYNMHETSASVFAGGGDCGAFSDGEGNGLAFGLFGEFPLIDQWLDLTTALTFARRGGAFGEAYTAGLPVLDPNSNAYVPLERKHDYTATLDFLLVDFGVRVTPFAAFPIYLRAAGSAGFPITEATYHQTEQILSPSGVLYPETNTTERDVATGPIRDVQTLVAAAGALGYTVPIGPRMTLAPEVSFSYPFTDVTLAYRWRVSTAQAGLAFRYDFGPKPQPPEPEPEPTPPVVAAAPVQAEPPPKAAIVAVSAPRVEVVRTIVTETFPILPYIFFDSSNSTLPTRYRTVPSESRDGFDENLLPHRSLDAYYSILDILGSRMRRSPTTAITLNGTTDGREETVAGAANNLARARAQTVKEYLINHWEIDPARIAVTTSARPTFPSSAEYNEGVQENRRVEINSPDDAILQPIIHEKFNEYSYQPKRIEFQADADSPAEIKTWSLTIQAGDKVVGRQTGTGTPPTTFAWQIDETAAAGISANLADRNEVTCLFDVVDGRGKSARAAFAIPASQSTHPFEVSRLSLIVFDFDKSAITPQNKRMIASFVSESIYPNSTSKITGSTDRLGELAHNQELSQARAVAVHDLITAQRPDANIISTEGIGPSRLLYDNNVPEGRYYCRTVTVEVETPIESLQAQ